MLADAAENTTRTTLKTISILLASIIFLHINKNSESLLEFSSIFQATFVVAAMAPWTEFDS